MVKFRGKQTNQSQEAWKAVYSQTDLFVRLGLGWINIRFTLKLSNHLLTDVQSNILFTVSHKLCVTNIMSFCKGMNYFCYIFFIYT